jgi:predicted RNA-binding protein with PIN domain
LTRLLTVVAEARDDNPRGDHTVRRAFLIIDGYNLLHAAGLARDKYARGQLARCRALLLAWLAKHLTEAERERTTVVFDAADAPPGLPRLLTAAGITVRFAAPGKDADDTIEELIAAHSAPRRIHVVSSDHRLQRGAQRRRGTFCDSEDFVQELERRGPVTADSPAPPDESPTTDEEAQKYASKTETEFWLRVFGQIPQAGDLASEVEPTRSLTQEDVARLKREIDREPEA